jgi:hypothetical protein
MELLMQEKKIVVGKYWKETKEVKFASLSILNCKNIRYKLSWQWPTPVVNKHP